jgi:hypothetical protein
MIGRGTGRCWGRNTPRRLRGVRPIRLPQLGVTEQERAEGEPVRARMMNGTLTVPYSGRVSVVVQSPRPSPCREASFTLSQV